MIKEHIERHKVMYAFGAGIVFAGITYTIMRGRYADFLRLSDTAAKTVFVRPLAFFSKQNVVVVIVRDGRGHPGYLVQCKETGEIFLSQIRAAEWAGISDACMSLHIRGKLPDIHGYHFERIAA